MENGDTVVVMTKAQADNINLVFRSNNAQISSLTANVSDMRSVSDSLATALFRSKVELNQAEHDAANAVYNAERKNRFQARMFFLFWGAFVTYLQLTT